MTTTIETKARELKFVIHPNERNVNLVYEALCLSDGITWCSDYNSPNCNKTCGYAEKKEQLKQENQTRR